MSDGDLRTLFRRYMPQGDWQAVETGAIASGVPDHNCCWAGVEFWIEYKATASAKVTNMRPAQVGWLSRRIRHGGRCFIAVRQKGHTLWLLQGAAARPLAERQALTSLAGALVLGNWAGGPSAWPWAQIGALLRG